MSKIRPKRLAKPIRESQRPKCVIVVTGDLPYYVPVPEGYSLSPSQLGAEPFQLEFRHFQPLRHPEDYQGENIDDRLGTFIRSRCRVTFPRMDLPKGKYKDDFLKKALTITNKALRAIRYKAYDPAIRHLSRFDNSIIRTIKFNKDGSAKPEVQFSQKHDFGPFGIRPLAELNEQALNDLWWYFNEITTMQSTWFLVLDSRYHNLTGDLPRAFLDLATALEINIDGLVNYYQRFNPSLNSIDLESHTMYWKYDQGLFQATEHSLHERPEYFINLEYIYGIRNSIAHAWKPEFRITEGMRKYSRYIDKHEPRDGHEIRSSNEVEELIKAAEAIISHTMELFKSKYESNK